MPELLPSTPPNVDAREPRGRRRTRKPKRTIPSGPPPQGVAGFVVRITRIAARFPKTVVLLWLVLIAGCVFAGASAGMKDLSDTTSVIGDSGRADQVLSDHGIGDRPSEQVLVKTGSRAATDRVAESLAAKLDRLPQVAAVASPYASGGSIDELRTPDGHAVLLRAELDPEAPGDPDEQAAAITKAVDAARKDHPGVTLAQAGSGSVNNAIDQIVSDDLKRAEVLSLPVTLLVLVLAFGAFAAASVPLALGITAVAGAMGALGVISHLVPNDDSTGSLVVLIGLAVGVDYSLFYVRREREERRKGASPEEALERAASSVGRAIIVAGSIVMVALAGLFLTGIGTFKSMGAGTIVVVAIAVLGSLTVLPAMLTLMGDRIDAGRVLGRRKARRAAAGLAPIESARPSLLARFVGGVARRPVTGLAVAVVLLLALAYPATSMRLGQGGMDSLPKGVPAIDALAKIDADFGGSSEADLVLSGTNLGSPQAKAGMRALAREAARSTGVRGYAPITVSPDGRAALVTIPMADQSPAAGQQSVRDLRAALAPVGTDLVPGAHRLLIGGDDAEGLDFRDTVVGAMPLVVGFVLGLALLLLLATFRSLPLALTVIALNLLSVGAAYGVMTAVFQHHWAEHALNFTSNGSVTTWLPLLAFVILFGLSMDYSILVLERIREARAAGLSPRAAAAEGVSATAGTVTGAAVVMVAVFSIFATLRLLEMKQLGVGLATAILVDATIVRAIALPAAVALLGDRAFPGAAREARAARAASRQADRKAARREPFRGAEPVCDDAPMAPHAALLASDRDA